MKTFLPFLFNALILLEAYRFNDETDKQALLDFKSQVSTVQRTVLSSWNNSNPLCNWKGVTCGSKHKRVTFLDLGGFNLGGVISPYIGNLSFLVLLNLENNSFVGKIPQEIGNLFRLQALYMSSNSLTGEIPVSLFNCSRLLALDLFSNRLENGVPSELGSLTKLTNLDLGANNLVGKLPKSLGNLTLLGGLGLSKNNFQGEIPDMSRLTQIVSLQIPLNNFSGDFPPAIYNMSGLSSLSMSGNRFSGNLRSDFGDLLPNIEDLYMGNNYLTGTIPTTLSNISNLRVVRIEYNNLTGPIPPSFGKVKNLKLLALLGNDLGSYSFGDLEFLEALTNCTKLEYLDVGENRLGGHLPTHIANMSKNLTFLSLQTNQISGNIPYEIGNLINLQTLRLEKNMLTGSIPKSIGKLSSLGRLSVYSNKMSGEIPSSIGNITQLVELYLFKNNFEGIIPPSISNCRQLQYLHIGSNKLNGTIPLEIMKIPQLILLRLSDNSLTGSLPKDVERLEHIGILSLAHNKLSGQLPQSLGNCLSIEELYLQGNSFDGNIPDIRKLAGLTTLDLANNNLHGSIPTYLANFSKLSYLNLSFNSLEGIVPTQGIFKNVSVVSVLGNKDLCGGIKELKLKPCSEQVLSMGKKRSSHIKKVAITVGLSILVMLFIGLVSLYWFRRRNKKQTSDETPPAVGEFHEKISYGDLRDATDGFSPDKMIGYGSFGTVFKAILPGENKVVAVKVLNLQRKGAMKSFVAECESLKDIRHRNLVKLLTACSSIDSQGNDFRALIYEFMPNGSLDMWLHPEEAEEIVRPSRSLTLFERLNIAVDVASVLEYLHVHCHEPIAHCDLKPSNVLLDDDLSAHVSDFGLARLLFKFDQDSFLNQLSSAGVRGTIGYAAPEYGMGGQPSIHGDVYSFGVLLLEMFTGKRPTNDLFGGSFTLHNYTKSALPERVLDITDKSILESGFRRSFDVSECLTMILDVGLRCCEDSPTNRVTMSEAARELVFIKEKFFKARSTKIN